MFQVNTITVTSRLTKEVTLKFAGENGTAYAKTSVAWDKRFFKDGEWQRVTTFADVTCWGKEAEAVAKFDKGNLVIVQGEVYIETYNNKQNVDVNKLVIENARMMKVELPAREPKEEQSQRQEPQQQRQAAPTNTGYAADDDVPF